jgi:hypothetical protein
MKLTAFWDLAPCSLVEVDDVSEVLTAFIRAKVPPKRRSVSARLHGARFQKAIRFISFIRRACHVSND